MAFVDTFHPKLKSVEKEIREKYHDMILNAHMKNKSLKSRIL